MRYVVSTDAGGTFVDAVILDDSGEISIGKAPSTPHNSSLGVLGAVQAAAESRGVTLQAIMENCRLFLNGTTVTTNAMIQRKGARTGLLTTKGFEDTLIIGRVKARTAGMSEAEVINYQRADGPPPIVPFSLTRGITERVDYKGRVLCPLRLEEVEARVSELVDAGIEALAVCLLWSFRNPSHERAIRDVVKEKHPHLYVVISSDLVPLIREYERANTTAINCFLGPTLDRYVSELQGALQEKGYFGEVPIMQSSGGLSPSREIRKVPIATLLSGPVGGVIASQKLGAMLGEQNIITTDMGGTSFDVALIVDGAAQIAPLAVIERYITMFPIVDVVTIGAGGGSVAWLDDTLTLRAGPQSQGAVPGPSCYGLGGDLPTVTDADVLLGYINPDFFLGGRMKLHRQRAVEAFERKVCEPLDITIEEAAAGVYEIINAHMADLIRKVSVERGHDPRGFVLFAFGGCGPTHCTAYAADVGVGKVIVPAAQTVFSALGIAQSDLKHSYSQSLLMTVPRNMAVDRDELTLLDDEFRRLLEIAQEQLHRDGVLEEDMVLIRSVDMRYRNQINELMVAVPTSGSLSQDGLTSLCSEFMRRYEMLYGPGSSSESAPIELINLRVDAVASSPVRYEPVEHPMGSGDVAGAFWGRRKVYWKMEKGFVDTDVYRGSKLRPGDVLQGPAVVELYGTTIPLHHGQRLAVDAYLNFIITFDRT